MGTMSAYAKGRYPEIAAGGFSRRDGTIAFYQRINALLAPDATVVDLGAGRGSSATDPVTFRRELTRIKGKVRHFVGVDIDPAVLGNPRVDEAIVIGPGENMPFADGSVDLVVSDWVLEHVRAPESFEQEVHRVLRSGGWFCARTSNALGLIGIASRVIPNRLHPWVLSHVQPDVRVREDVFPTYFRMNTKRELNRRFGKSRWETIIVPHSPEPAYHGGSAIWFEVQRWSSLPSSFSTTLLVYARKL